MEEFRLQYPLDAKALVLDAGAFRGDFISWCRDRWKCRVIAFEPGSAFYKDVAKRFQLDAQVEVYNCGLGAVTERLPLAIQGDSTSIYGASAEVETVLIRDVAQVFESFCLDAVDLFKINIEGGEYPLMQRLLDCDLARRVRFFQVQYHGMGAGPEGPAVARDRIRERLNETHREEWCVNGGQWESWAIR